MQIVKTTKQSNRIELDRRNSKSKDRQITLERKQKRQLKYQTQTVG